MANEKTSILQHVCNWSQDSKPTRIIWTDFGGYSIVARWWKPARLMVVHAEGFAGEGAIRAKWNGSLLLEVDSEGRSPEGLLYHLEELIKNEER